MGSLQIRAEQKPLSFILSLALATVALACTKSSSSGSSKRPTSQGEGFPGYIAQNIDPTVNTTASTGIFTLFIPKGTAPAGNLSVDPAYVSFGDLGESKLLANGARIEIRDTANQFSILSGMYTITINLSDATISAIDRLGIVLQIFGTDGRLTSQQLLAIDGTTISLDQSDGGVRLIVLMNQSNIALGAVELPASGAGAGSSGDGTMYLTHWPDDHSVLLSRFKTEWSAAEYLFSDASGSPYKRATMSLNSSGRATMVQIVKDSEQEHLDLYRETALGWSHVPDYLSTIDVVTSNFHVLPRIVFDSQRAGWLLVIESEKSAVFRIPPSGAVTTFDLAGWDGAIAWYSADIVVDDQDRVHVFIVTNGDSGLFLSTARLDLLATVGMTRLSDIPDCDFGGYPPIFGVARKPGAGVGVVFNCDQSNVKIRYAEYSLTSEMWSTPAETIYGPGGTTYATRPILDYDSAGMAHIVWRNDEAEIGYLRQTSASSWSGYLAAATDSDSSQSAEHSLGFAIDADDVGHLVYRDSTFKIVHKTKAAAASVFSTAQHVTENGDQHLIGDLEIQGRLRRSND